MKPVLFAYARVSTFDQNTSIEEQSFRLTKEYEARYKDSYTWGGVFADSGITGKIPLAERAAGSDMVVRIRPGDAVMITRLDRAFRSARNALEMIDSWRAGQVRLIMLDGNIDIGTPLGKAMLGILAVFADMEREILRERIMEGFAHAKRQGRVLGAAPYGYKLVGRKAQRKIVPDPESRTLARRIIQWRDDECWSMAEIRRYLVENRVAHFKGKPPHLSTLYLMYENEKKLQKIEEEYGKE